MFLCRRWQHILAACLLMSASVVLELGEKRNLHISADIPCLRQGWYNSQFRLVFTVCATMINNLMIMVAGLWTLVGINYHMILVEGRGHLPKYWNGTVMSLLRILSKVFSRSIVFSGYVGYYCCVAHCTMEYLGDFVICSGPSMEPTIYSDDIIFTEHVSIMRRKINRGDIIVARSPSNPKQYICKRVKAVPGDKIRKGFLTEVVPHGHVWLEGDNKSNSTDSRTYGPVPIALLRGRAVCRIWPYEKAKFFASS